MSHNATLPLRCLTLDVEQDNLFTFTAFLLLLHPYSMLPRMLSGISLFHSSLSSTLKAIPFVWRKTDKWLESAPDSSPGFTARDSRRTKRTIGGSDNTQRWGLGEERGGERREEWGEFALLWLMNVLHYGDGSQYLRVMSDFTGSHRGKVWEMILDYCRGI